MFCVFLNSCDFINVYVFGYKIYVISTVYVCTVMGNMPCPVSVCMEYLLFYNSDY